MQREEQPCSGQHRLADEGQGKPPARPGMPAAVLAAAAATFGLLAPRALLAGLGTCTSSVIMCQVSETLACLQLCLLPLPLPSGFWPRKPCWLGLDPAAAMGSVPGVRCQIRWHACSCACCCCRRLWASGAASLAGRAWNLNQQWGQVSGSRYHGVLAAAADAFGLLTPQPMLARLETCTSGGVVCQVSETLACLQLCLLPLPAPLGFWLPRALLAGLETCTSSAVRCQATGVR